MAGNITFSSIITTVQAEICKLASKKCSHGEVVRVDRPEVLERGEGLTTLLPEAENKLQNEGVRVLQKRVVYSGVLSQT